MWDMSAMQDKRGRGAVRFALPVEGQAPVTFTQKQMAVGKEEFERRLAGLREYAYSDAHPILTRGIVWEVAYIDGVFAENVRLRAALQAVVDAGESWPFNKLLDAREAARAALAAAVEGDGATIHEPYCTALQSGCCSCEGGVAAGSVAGEAQADVTS